MDALEYLSDRVFGRRKERTQKFLRRFKLKKNDKMFDGSVRSKFVELVGMSYKKKSDRQRLFEDTECLYKSGQYRAVIEKVDQCIDHYSEWRYKALKLKAHSHYVLRQFTESLASWNRLKLDDPYEHDKTAIWSKGDCLVSLGQYAAAQALYEPFLNHKGLDKNTKAQHRIQLEKVLDAESDPDRDIGVQIALLEEAIPALTSTCDIEWATTRLIKLNSLSSLNKRKQNQNSADDDKEDDDSISKPKKHKTSSEWKDWHMDLKQVQTSTTEILGMIKAIKPQCVICLSAMRTVRFDCGHVIACQACADTLSAASSQPLCPNCRKPCKPFLPIFL